VRVEAGFDEGGVHWAMTLHFCNRFVGQS
jgi:hypothetical protein